MQERVSMLPPGGNIQEEKLNNQETASLLKQKEASEGAVAMAPNTHHHGNNPYKESNIKNACEMEEARLHYKPVDNDV